MKLSWIKYDKDINTFKVPEKLGFDVFKLEEPDQIDKKINELVKEKYDTIIISNQIAGFSEDIIKKYSKKDDINIIISRTKE